MAEGVKTALGEAVSEHRAAALQPQRDLFDAMGARTELDEAIAAARSNEAILEQAWREEEARRERDETAQAGPRGPGRPKGARNLRTEEAARFYVRRHGDPLEQAVKLGAIPILARGVLEALAQRLGCTRLEAAKFWASNNQAVMPFIRPRLGSLELRPAGSPESDEAVTWEHWDYIDGELVDKTITEDKAIEAQDVAAEITTEAAAE